MAIGYLDSTYLSNIADSIRAKKGTSNSMTLSQMPQEISSIPSPKVGAIILRVFDYDGTLIEEYTASELESLTSLPTPPDHTQDEIPRTFDEYNWTLEEVKAYHTSYPTFEINIGANYHTTDNKFHAILEIPYSGYVAKFSMGNATGIIDWGDGTTESVSLWGAPTHTYAKGRYHFTASCGSSGGASGFADNSYAVVDIGIWNTRGVSGIQSSLPNLRSISFPSTNSYSSYSTTPSPQGSLLKWVSIPRVCTSMLSRDFVGKYAPTYHGTTLPSDVYYKSFFENVQVSQTTLNNNTFNQCYRLGKVSLAEGLTALPDNTFYQCESLIDVSLPSTLTSIGQWAIYRTSLESLTIPSNVTSIGNFGIYSNSKLDTLIMKPTVPPTLSSSSVYLDGTYSRVIVPYSVDHSILTAYQTAQYWSSLSSKMVEDDPS